MARAAKVPKTKRRYRLSTRATGHFVSGIDNFYIPVAAYSQGRKIARALNLLEAIERGELIVKEAE